MKERAWKLKMNQDRAEHTEVQREKSNSKHPFTIVSNRSFFGVYLVKETDLIVVCLSAEVDFFISHIHFNPYIFKWDFTKKKSNFCGDFNECIRA